MITSKTVDSDNTAAKTDGLCVVISYESSTVLLTQASTMIKEHLSKFQVSDLLQPPMYTAHTMNKQTEIKL